MQLQTSIGKNQEIPLDFVHYMWYNIGEREFEIEIVKRERDAYANTRTTAAKYADRSYGT